MRLPKSISLGLRALFSRTFGSRGVSRLIKVSLDVAYGLMWLITGVLILALIITVFVPMQQFQNATFVLGEGTDARAIPVSRSLLLFGVGSFAVYFTGFTLILRNLRKVFSTLSIGDPFHPANVRRLRQVGFTLAIVTTGVWVWQGLVAHLSHSPMQPPNLFDLLTPVFSVLIVFVLAEVFREGARLRRESELTI